MSDENTLLIAIPTYKRSEDVGELLRAIHFVSAYRNVTVIIFDSSTDDKTLRIVDKNERDGFKNISYEKIEEKIPSNEKVFYIYEKYTNRFSYIWVMHDHTTFTEEAFQYLMNSIGRGYDFLFVQMQGSEYRTIVYEDKLLFAQKNAWFLGKMGASVVGTDSFLREVNWDYYREKYLTDININFSHVGFFLERLCDKDFAVVEVQFPLSQCFDRHKYEKLNWEKEALRICTQCWGSVITSLPDAYTNKQEIINAIDPYFMNSYKLLMGVKQGYYTIDDYKLYKKWIQLVFPELLDDAYKIATLTEDELMEQYVGPFKERIDTEMSDGRTIYIYGAGRHGMECLELMEFAGISPKGFLVSSIEGNPESIRGCGVYELEEVIQNHESVFAILAVMEKLQIEIEELLKDKVNLGADITWMRY